MTAGMLLGKFMPPHLGHVYLGEFAGRFVDRLPIVVCSLRREPIPGAPRFRWMQELFPFDNVVHLTDELPQQPDENPNFWDLWRLALPRMLPGRPDYVFESKPYGWRLAKELGAAFVAVDAARSAVPVSGTAIQTDPAAHWEYIPRRGRRSRGVTPRVTARNHGLSSRSSDCRRSGPDSRAGPRATG